MKKSRRVLCIALSLMVMFTLSSLSAFALEGVEAPASGEGTVEAQAVDIAGADVAAIPDQLYTGVDIQPEPQVTYGDTILVKDTDYTLSWDKNTFPTKKAEVIITGIGEYTGTKTVLFTIYKEEQDRTSIADAEVEGIEDKGYTGYEVIQEDMTVVLGDEPLDLDEDYTVTYQNNIGSAEQDTVATLTIEGINDYKGTITREFTILAAGVAIQPVKNLKALSGNNRIKLKWDKVEGANTYYIMRKGKESASGWPRDIHNLINRNLEYGGKSWEEVAEAPYWENRIDVDKFTKYKYTVYAVYDPQYDPNNAAYAAESQDVEAQGEGLETAAAAFKQSEGKSVSKKPVSKLRITVKIKSGTTLTSTDGKVHYTIHSGQKIKTEGYGGGKYYFKKKVGGKNHWFRVMNIRTYGETADYATKLDYSKEEAEYFINDAKLTYAKPSSTSKKYFIWASLYTQQVHVFKKSGGKWVQVKCWDCSSGSADAPSPTGNCNLHKKIAYRHHISHWNCFSTLNALHGIKPVRYAGYNWIPWLGHIKSQGCIRNRDENATWIWNNCAIGTKILVQ